ncbi:PEP-CTERM sorting domain-containing protein [Paucibacter sp. XJ19-41]|uniref:PEP-CTERM sorting domain-containing protein n=1 Tax=Paucibacter sp. XJ19-41 TaxID=2927824 RepID=UPI00234BE409|nr:PEP-CTERM sorting domain-containing protein [Paucibacter sp. XJ19-41]MDC6167038.1 PEP-CTERM sorting domain-containing protein [Paucibacter sp. XJ19-41]
MIQKTQALTRLLAACGLLLASATAVAQLPSFQLDWVQRTGTATTLDSIDVGLRLSLAPGQAGMSLDPANYLSLSDLPLGTHIDDDGQGHQAAFASIDWSQTRYGSSLRCYNSFDASCGLGEPNPYRTEWHFGGDGDPARLGILDLPQMSLRQVEFIDFYRYRFVPGSAVTPGQYRLSSADIRLHVAGYDQGGNALRATVPLTSICPAAQPDCAFVRTVTAVPEPSTWGLMSAGLLLIVGAAQRRRKRQA